MSEYNNIEMKNVLKQMLGTEFIDLFEVNIPQIKHIQVFVKTTDEFIWGERFGMDDPAYDYLENLGYTKISIIAAKEIEGRWLQ